jgi:hypothetical protein
MDEAKIVLALALGLALYAAATVGSASAALAPGATSAQSLGRNSPAGPARVFLGRGSTPAHTSARTPRQENVPFLTARAQLVLSRCSPGL